MDLGSFYPKILRDPEHDDIVRVSFPEHVAVLRGETIDDKFYPSELSIQTRLSDNEKRMLSNKMGDNNELSFDE